MANTYWNYWQNLSPETVETLPQFVSPDFSFTDPFHTNINTTATIKMLRGMFKRLHTPRFIVLDTATGQHGQYAKWDFTYQLRQRGRVRTIRGMSEIGVNEAGLATSHIDHWDTVTQLYKKLLLG